MNLIASYFRRNWINYLIFFLLISIAFYLAKLPNEALVILRFVPFVFVILNLALAVLFNKSKMFFIALMNALTLLVLLSVSIHIGDRFNDLLFFATGVLIPLNYLWISRSQEKGILSISGRFKFFFIFLQCLLIIYVLLFQESILSGIQTWQLFPHDFRRLMAPADAVIILFLGLMLMDILRDFILQDSNCSLRFFSLSTLFLAILKPSDPGWYSLFFIGNGIFLTIALFGRSYAMAYLDDLTGIPGRRALNEELHKLSGHFSIAMIDIDHFKKFNDDYGHDTGDEALRHVASTIRKTVRGGKLFRFGGEEFTILYPGFEMSHSLINLEEVRRAVETSPLSSKTLAVRKTKPGRLKITISIGVAQRDNFNRSTEVLREADHALYRAKDNGRNRVCH